MSARQRPSLRPAFRLTDDGRAKADAIFQAAREARILVIVRDQGLWMDSREADFVAVLRSMPGAVETWDARELDALRMIMRLRFSEVE